ncbi:hypothetical protein [Kangiella koreensis]|uniref:Uncharacterized protein n=1 Tax=Kangiella koreensis (strain DSM 16069 / JCM 12317 / KCTC 12182 / SW-125) TaxID=523791 RepID=C7R746_KANKD|nr:hypothetical protein [Kangiella koreensis]ACV27502.1 hypothetical protein Kkor_2092 [Kangiella koreensis DSM 16069]
MRNHKNIVHLPVENKRIDEPEAVNGWWLGLYNNVMSWSRQKRQGNELVDELQALRERNRDYRTVVRSATVILNRQYDDELANKKKDTDWDNS